MAEYLTKKTDERNERVGEREGPDHEFADITKNVIGGTERGTGRVAQVTGDIGKVVSVSSRFLRFYRRVVRIELIIISMMYRTRSTTLAHGSVARLASKAHPNQTNRNQSRRSR